MENKTKTRFVVFDNSENEYSKGFDCKKVAEKFIKGRIQSGYYSDSDLDIKDLKLIYLEADGEYVTIEIECNDEVHREHFTVQLSGGEYLSQMGCWIIADGYEGGDVPFSTYQGGLFADFEGDIIIAAEKSHKEYIDAEINDKAWENVDFDSHYGCNISATSQNDLVIQRMVDDSDEYRWFYKGSGFTQSNDYSSMPEIIIRGGYSSVESVLSEINERDELGIEYNQELNGDYR